MPGNALHQVHLHNSAVKLCLFDTCCFVDIKHRYKWHVRSADTEICIFCCVVY